ncbi:MAG: iron-containing alcohol dehydrogenase [Desulfovibrionaceae bacterium]|nr:iron-containing alcohol dehydrogenase [Desulfovibrionaceae bacterium]
MSEEFFFQLHTNVFYGLGASRDLGGFVRDRGFSRVLMLVDEGCAKHSAYFREIREIIELAAGSLHVEQLRGTEEPDYDYLDQVAGHARSLGDFELVLGIGGGSCMDMAKAVAMLLTNPGRGIDYRGFDKVRLHPVATVCVPTTAGTGSEVTINAVFTDKAERRKLGINGRFMNADWAVLDAEWTMSCPQDAALSSGMDAMTHALESFSCKQHNVLTRAYSKEAFRILYQNLPCLKDDPENRDRRQLLLLGSYLAAAGLFNSGSGVAGAFSYPLGAHFKVPHGIGGAIFLASVVEYNVERGYTDYAELLDLVECRPELDEREKSRRFALLLRELSDGLGVPRTLAKWGLARDKADQVAALMLPLQAAFDQNPVPFSAEEDAPRLLMKHLD